MQDYCITKLIGLENVIVSNVVETDTHLEIFIETKPCHQSCPQCGERTRSIHDYRLQKIRDVKFREMYTYLVLKKRRYKCTSCGKRFYERYPFLERYQRHTIRVLQALLIKVRTANFKEVAKELGLGHSTVIRWFDRYYTYENHSLPQILAIDEFKGTTEKGKYQCVIGDPRGFKVFDVIQDRKLSTLKDYFRSLPTHRVQMVVMDMWQPYKILAQQLFQNPIIIVDKFHYARHNFWALERVRKRVQKSFQDKDRKSMKKLRFLLHKPKEKLTTREQELLQYYLELSPDLKKAYQVKEVFKKWMTQSNEHNVRLNLEQLYQAIDESGLDEYQYMKRTFKSWEKEIINSFMYPYTNGYLEGINNKIKVIKRMSYGIRNFQRLRNKVLCSLI
jgi:Transposase and inactivated derivatives